MEFPHLPREHRALGTHNVKFAINGIYVFTMLYNHYCFLVPEHLRISMLFYPDFSANLFFSCLHLFSVKTYIVCKFSHILALIATLASSTLCCSPAPEYLYFLAAGLVNIAKDDSNQTAECSLMGCAKAMLPCLCWAFVLAQQSVI